MSNIASKQQQKEQAIKIMTQLGLDDYTVKSFSERDAIHTTNYFDTIDILSYDERKFIKEYEEKTGCIVYYFLHDLRYSNNHYYLFTISKYEEDWQFDKVIENVGLLYVYVHNVVEPGLSEYGTVKVKSEDGKLFLK